MNEERIPVKFHITDISPNRWQIIYDEVLTLKKDDHLLYEYDKNDMPEKIWIVKGNKDE
jgi:hypothetical protein